MNETVGVIIHGLGLVLALPAFVFLVMLVFRRKAPKPTVTIYRRDRSQEDAVSARPRQLH
jgi:hypothetical protein